MLAAIRTILASDLGPGARRAKLELPDRNGRLRAYRVRGIGAEAPIVLFEDISLEESGDRMRTEFVYSVSHELKTPLTTIAVAGSTLAQPGVQQDPEQVKRLSGLIRSENRHLSRLIDQLLDINVWERDNITLQMKETDIGPLLQKIADAFRLEHKERTFTLETEIDAALEGVKVRLDEFYFSVALHNLLSNALKYGGNPPRIGMKAFVKGDLLVVEVTDNGRGIPPEEQKHLFEKFYRGRAARKHIRGLGLGLFYVKKILEMHGGDVILAESTAKGSVFRIVLPLKNIQA